MVVRYGTNGMGHINRSQEALALTLFLENLRHESRKVKGLILLRVSILVGQYQYSAEAVGMVC